MLIQNDLCRHMQHLQNDWLTDPWPNTQYMKNVQHGISQHLLLQMSNRPCAVLWRRINCRTHHHYHHNAKKILKIHLTVFITTFLMRYHNYESDEGDDYNSEKQFIHNSLANKQQTWHIKSYIVNYSHKLRCTCILNYLSTFKNVNGYGRSTSFQVTV